MFWRPKVIRNEKLFVRVTKENFDWVTAEMQKCGTNNLTQFVDDLITFIRHHQKDIEAMVNNEKTGNKVQRKGSGGSEDPGRLVG